MVAFILRRLIQSLFVMFFVALVSFSMFRFVGDPVNQMVGIETSIAEREALRERLGLNDPFMVQFGRYIGKAATGEFGISYQHKRPVAEMLVERMPATLELALVSAVFSLLLGVPMGVYAGLNRDGFISKVLLSVSLVGISLPTFLIGILLIFFFSVQLNLLPSFGRGGLIDIGLWKTGLLTIDGWKSLIMPSITLGLFQLTLIMRLVRSEMLEVLRTDYIKFARARGLTNRAVHFGHALKNTLVPVITITGLQLGSIIAFAIITETVFQWPGMGQMFLQAVTTVDIPIMAAYLMLIAFFFVVINLIVDLLYYVVDPRLRVDTGKASGHG
ncbi:MULTISPECIES: ABC transporter permease [Thalassobaculum]|uniref:Peptide/nickel transport system permease protein n=1 Tax=Thalassobaculum litoreum DSM 18839 TaxID=1123362 RepID=A0A8G2BFJ4_9PROT|nr:MULTISPECIES: ABC transporter permease [Thalassobaculum]SDF26027.1 peptide/nickel transport system permease protein [Thalassobaculum litoreum DSM 18839]